MRKALLVGIDHYDAAPLSGCVNDARALADLLSRHENGDRNFDCKLILSGSSSTITADRMGAAVDSLLRNNDELALFHFSGHGTKDGADQACLLAQDESTYRLLDLLQQISQSQARHVVVLLDCCFSGGLGTTQLADERYSTLREGVGVLAASRPDEPAAEQAGSGLFSSLVIGGLQGGAADVLGKVTLAGLYAYVDEALGAWDQRPLFKANVTQLIPLRLCAPLVPKDTLRRLPTLFPDADYVFPLDPSYEPDERYQPKNSEHEEVFARLQECNRMRLVDPVDAQHMFYAAIDSTGCRLTPLGVRYWRMAKEGRL